MENKLYFIIILVGCILLFLGIIIAIIYLWMDRKEDWRDYDSYILSIGWGPSICYNKKEKKEECFDQLDKLNINKSFIIHGLWPTYSSGEYIENCNKRDDIEVTFDETYKRYLSKIWPNITNDNIWTKEYNDHGYCYIQRLRKNVDVDYKFYFDKTKEKKVDFKKYGMDGWERKSGYITDFSKSKKFLYEVTVLGGIKKVTTESFYKDNSESYIVIDKTKIKVNFNDDTVIAEDSSFMPVKVLAINHFERDGKVYSMPGHEKAGAKITLYNQEYAVIDFISENPTILLNSKFLRELTVEETDFAAALMLGLYEMNQTTED